MNDGDWLGIPTEMWSGIVGGVIGAVVGGWIAHRSAAKERLLNRVTRLLELYQEHGHQIIDTDQAIGQLYKSMQEQEVAKRERRTPLLPPPEDLLPEVRRQFELQMATFRLIAAQESDPRRTVPLKSVGQHLVREFQSLTSRKYDEAHREHLLRCQYHTHLNNAVLELMHHLPQIPPLGFWGKKRWEGASHQRREEEKRLTEFTTRVVEERIDADRKAAAEQQR